MLDDDDDHHNVWQCILAMEGEATKIKRIGVSATEPSLKQIPDPGLRDSFGSECKRVRSH